MRTKRFEIISRLGTVLFIFGLVMAMNANIFICEARPSLAPIRASSGTEVGGIIEENTTWTLEGSPYLMTETVQIPEGVILTIARAVPPFLVYLNITPAELELGDNVTISVDIRNPNDRAISYGFTLEIGGPYEIQILWIAWTELVDVELEAYESKTVSRTITPTAVGTYNVTVRARTTYNTTVIGLTGNFTVKAPPKPAEFVVTDLTVSPSEVSEGEPVTVSVTVTNIGEEEGTRTVKLNIDGLVTELGGWHAVTLEGGVSTTISFTLTAAEGVHTVGVDGLTGGFTVKPKPSFWDKIPGFPYESIILGLIAVIIILWYARARKF